jgi:hypothetical protein
VAPPPPHFEIPDDPAEEPDWDRESYAEDESAEPEPELSPCSYPDFDRDVDAGSKREMEPRAPLRTRAERRQIEEEHLAAISAQERRASCRYPVADTVAVLSWWEPIASPSVVLSAPKEEPKLAPDDESIYRRVMARWPAGHSGTAAARATAELARDPLPPVEESMQSRASGARLVDISQTGLMVLSEAVPPADGRIWLRLETPLITDWVEVVVKGSSLAAPGAHRVRLAFREGCPYDIFKAVVYTKPGS